MMMKESIQISYRYFLCPLFLLMGSVCHADDININFKASTAKVEHKANDSVKVTVDGASVNIESLYKDHKLTVRMKGKSDDGRLMLKSAGKAKVTLDGLTLTSQEGAPLDLKNKKKVEVVAAKGTENTLTITACKDTANHKAAVIWAKDKLLLSGKGTLNIVATGDGCRGIKTKKDITIEELTLNVTTTGDNLGEKPFGFGGFPGMPKGGFPDFGGGFPGFPGGAFPMGNDSTARGGFPGMPGGGFPDFGNRDDSEEDGEQSGFAGFAGKHKYVASTKGIASKGKITINSGNVTVRTSTAGAEGIEGKDGIVFNGGKVDVQTPDDAINANAPIEFNGAHVTAYSMGNDAVDANPQGGFFPPFGGGGKEIEPSIIITGGTVYAWSQVGPPEEGLDSDFAPIAISGGNIFSVGGSMGGSPSVPSNETAKQPTVLLGSINIVEDEPIQIFNAKGKLIDTVTIPFSLKRSSSLVSSPAFKMGETYTVKTKDYEKTFTLNENLTIVR
jgi:hypothetical protein